MTDMKNPPSSQRWVSSGQNHRTRVNGKSIVSPNSTPIYCNGKVIGEVTGEIFHKTVTRQKHLFRKFNGYAFNIGTLQQAEQAGAKFVEIRERDTCNTFKVSIETIYKLGISPPVNDYGPQLCLALRYWRCDGKSSNGQLSFLAGDAWISSNNDS
jgi:hypothetical protein